MNLYNASVKKKVPTLTFWLFLLILIVTMGKFLQTPCSFLMYKIYVRIVWAEFLFYLLSYILTDG